MTSTLSMRDATVRGGLRLIVGWLMPLAIAAILVPVMVPVGAHAQAVPETTEARLRRIEGELRALQRKVFPDGAGRTFAPQITPDETAGPTPPPVAAGSNAALGDLLARMDAVESQMKALTASSEENQNRLAKLETRIGAVETTQAAAAAAATPAVAPAQAPDTAPPPPPARSGKAAAKPVDANPSAPQAADHAAALAAIERPSTDDKGEDAYTYGYRLWEAKFLPEAEAVLNDFVQQYPRHKRISFARNLLGRAYLDDNKPGAAAQWFLQNYQADKAGDRAADSLLYLGVAMTRLKETKRACVVLDEFRQTYPTEADGRLKGQFDAVTKTVTCH